MMIGHGASTGIGTLKSVQIKLRNYLDVPDRVPCPEGDSLTLFGLKYNHFERFGSIRISMLDEHLRLTDFPFDALSLE